MKYFIFNNWTNTKIGTNSVWHFFRGGGAKAQAYIGYSYSYDAFTSYHVQDISFFFGGGGL